MEQITNTIGECITEICNVMENRSYTIFVQIVICALDIGSSSFLSAQNF